MKKELIEQWQLYKEALDEMIEEKQLFTHRERWLTFPHFMVWLESGRFDNGYKSKR
jgi:hypothetical protein